MGVRKEDQVMAEEKIGGEATETDQSAKVADPYLPAGERAGEYYDPASATAGEYYEATRERAAKLYDTATAKAGEVVATTREQADSISAAVEAGKLSAIGRDISRTIERAIAERAYAEAQRLTGREVGRLLDATGKPMEGHGEWHGGALSRGTTEGFVNLTINQGEFDRLSIKTREILAEAALAQERIAKDQEEIDILKVETRETLRRLRAA